MILSFTRTNGDAAIIVADACISESHVDTATVSEHAVDSGANISDHVRQDNPSLNVQLVFSNTPVNAGVDSYYDGVRGEVSDAKFEIARPLRRRQNGNPILVDPGASPTTIRRSTGPALNVLNFIPQTGKIPTGTILNYAGNVPIPGRLPVWEPQPETELSVVESFSVLQFGSRFDRVGAIYKELIDAKNNAILVTAQTSLRTYENMILVGVNPTRDVSTGNILQVTLDLRQLRIVASKTVQITKPLQTRGKKAKAKGVQPTKEANPAEKKASLGKKLATAIGNALVRNF